MSAASPGECGILSSGRRGRPCPLDRSDRLSPKWRRRRPPLHRTNGYEVRRRPIGSLLSLPLGRVVSGAKRLCEGGRANDARLISVQVIRPVSAIDERRTGSPSMTLHAAPKADAVLNSSTSRAENPSLRPHSSSSPSRPAPCNLRNRARHKARVNAARNGMRASSQDASGSVLRIRKVSATPPGARPFVRPEVITWTDGQYRILAS